jgi:hypothetical protein
VRQALETGSQFPEIALYLGFQIFGCSPVFVLDLLSNPESFVSDRPDTEDAKKYRWDEDCQEKNQDNLSLSFEGDF